MAIDGPAGPEIQASSVIIEQGPLMTLSPFYAAAVPNAPANTMIPGQIGKVMRAP